MKVPKLTRVETDTRGPCGTGVGCGLVTASSNKSCTCSCYDGVCQMRCPGTMPVTVNHC